MRRISSAEFTVRRRSRQTCRRTLARSQTRALAAIAEPFVSAAAQRFSVSAQCDLVRNFSVHRRRPAAALAPTALGRVADGRLILALSRRRRISRSRSCGCSRGRGLTVGYGTLCVSSRGYASRAKKDCTCGRADRPESQTRHVSEPLVSSTRNGRDRLDVDEHRALP